MLRWSECGVTYAVGVGQDVIQFDPGVERRAEVAVGDRRRVVNGGSTARSLGVAAVVGVVVDEAVEHVVRLAQLLREGEERGVLGPRLAGEARARVLQVEDLLQLGDRLEELRLEGVEQRKRVLGGGDRGRERRGG